MEADHFDVVIVGAGLSGVGAACHLQRGCPRRTYVILEARQSIGGTWDLFRYPGIRSDSDMHTLGYAFKPWEDPKAIADGPAILRYVRSTAAEYDVEPRIRFGHRVVSAIWSSSRARWTVHTQSELGEAQFTCAFLHMCTGYYRYDEGYTPPLPGIENFTGPVIHPQHWPRTADLSGRRVVVIGSGATAVTLVPALAAHGAHVTMLQRSPSYMVSLPSHDPLAERLRARLPERTAYALIRRRNILQMSLFYRLSRRFPGLVRRALMRSVARQLPDGFDVARHFSPRYNPWDQRVCLVPDGDLFAALRSGRASIATDTITGFGARSVELSSGRTLEADVVVTATGLNLQLFGGAAFTVDGQPVDFGQTVAYKGMMFSGVPNLALSIGYTNASWTLKADLVCEYVCRLLRHMEEHGLRQVTPLPPPPGEQLEPLLGLSSGYIVRALDALPKQGTRIPWRVHQNYTRDVRLLRDAPLEDGALVFSAGHAPARPAATELATV